MSNESQFAQINTRITESVGGLHAKIDGVADDVKANTLELARRGPVIERACVCVGELEGKVQALHTTDIELTAGVKALTASFGAAQVEQERRHSEVLDTLREGRAQQAALETAKVAADASKWDALKDPKVLVISAVVLLAVLAPEALPIVLHYGGQVFGLNAPEAVEASPLPE